MSFTLSVSYINSTDFSSSGLSFATATGLSVTPAVYSEEVFWATYHATGSADGLRGNGGLTATASGTVTATSDRLDLTAANSYVDYGSVDFTGCETTGCIRFDIRPNYSGSPAGITPLFVFWDSTDSLSSSRIDFSQDQASGKFKLTMYKNTGSSAFNLFSPSAWNPTTTSDYLLELNWQTSPQTLVNVFLDGASLMSYSTSTTFGRGTATKIRVAGDVTAVNQTSLYLNDLRVFNTVQHTAEYTGDLPLSVPYPYTTSELTAVDIVNTLTTDAIQSHTTSSNIPSGCSIKYGLYNYSDSTLYYHTGSSWISSDGTLSQANSSSDLNTAPAFSVGGEYQIHTIVQSSGWSTPSILSADWGYNYWAQKTAPSECIVYGYILDAEGNAVSGATVEISHPDFMYGCNLIVQDTTLTTDSIGYFSASLVETSTNNITTKFKITYGTGANQEKKIFSGIIPNTATASFCSFVS